MEDVSSVPVKQCYNSTSFKSMIYGLNDGIWVHNSEICAPSTPFPKSWNSSPPNLNSSSVPCDISDHLTDIDARLNALKDLVLGTHFR